MSSKNKRFLVTGSDGFIGSNLVKSFEEGVVIFDRSKYSLFDEASLKPLPKKQKTTHCARQPQTLPQQQVKVTQRDHQPPDPPQQQRTE